MSLLLFGAVVVARRCGVLVGVCRLLLLPVLFWLVVVLCCCGSLSLFVWCLILVILVRGCSCVSRDVRVVVGCECG